MNIDAPASGARPELESLWREAFGDSDAFRNDFFRTAFSPSRCRCLTLDARLAAALYWFDVSCRGEKLAYLYAVATAVRHRGQGLCRLLMQFTHAHLAELGYRGAILVPGSAPLRAMYAGFGYRNFGGIRTFSCRAGTRPAALRRVGIDEYALLRRRLLPPGGVIQEGESLAFLQTQAVFYASDRFLLAMHPGNAAAPELLGDAAAAPGILAALGAPYGTFRTPGASPFAMYLPLGDPSAPAPGYFGLAFD